jgi:hypothetical protein
LSTPVSYTKGSTLFSAVAVSKTAVFEIYFSKPATGGYAPVSTVMAGSFR